jgi:adenosine kinase
MERSRIFLMGTPLLDLILETEDRTLLDKHGLKPGDSILADESHRSLFEDIWKQPAMNAMPGGSCLNASRSCAYSLKAMGVSESKVDYSGAIGMD